MARNILRKCIDDKFGHDFDRSLLTVDFSPNIDGEASRVCCAKITVQTPQLRNNRDQITKYVYKIHSDPKLASAELQRLELAKRLATRTGPAGLPVPWTFRTAAADQQHIGVIEFDDIGAVSDLQLTDDRPAVEYDLSTARRVLQHIGRFHGASLRLPRSERGVGERRPVGGMAALAADESRLGEWLAHYDAAIGTLDDDETGLQEEVEAIRDSYQQRLRTLLTGRGGSFDEAEAYLVQLHGDLWSRNLLVDGDQVVALDWSQALLGVPAVDFAQFVFGSVRSDVRREHFEDLLLAYHGALVEGAEGPDDAYPLDVFRVHLEYYAQYALLVMPRLLGELLTKGVVTPEEYRRRMGDVVRDFSVLGYEVCGTFYYHDD